MKFKGYSYMGTLIAIVVVVIVVLLDRFVFVEEEATDSVIIPTERETLEFLENTQFGTIPTE